MDLDELIQRRRALEVDLAVHEASLRRFWPSDQRPSFVIAQAEHDHLPPDKGRKPLHMTSSASCFESLADREPRFAGELAPDRDDRRWRRLAESFARRALDTRPNQWMSDEAAHVYCRVRTLPAVLRFAPKLKSSSRRQSAARDRLTEAFAVIDGNRPLVERGLGERVLDKQGKAAPHAGPELYPANAFHAYWGAKANAQYEARRATRKDLDPLPATHRLRVTENHAWAQAAMTRQSALLLGGKRRGDAQQLVFALLTDLLASTRQLTPASERFDLYDSALRAFFGAQEPTGRWPQSAPLFHYPQSGNAYCYTFETLTELLRPALPREEGRGLRTLLEPHLAKLLTAWDYAMETRVPLDDARGDTYGWSSQHHVTRNDPEAWATAEVFAFGQLLRCVSGHIVAERAAIELKARRPEYASRSVAEEELGSRGSTWTTDRWTVGRQLAAMFLHPVRMPGPATDNDVRDPEATVIGDGDARSAVLFGPPGTGKTTLVEALAGALGWQYIEVLASDFLSAGIDAVPARADLIFDRLMQLDRCVVLFDEIDELIRDRTADTSDPFGRFLTTSMLPKIAKLWKQRRLIFFVATNHVSKADPAITRSSRFDASIFVAPPGLDVKRKLLRERLKDKVPVLDDNEIAQTLASEPKKRGQLTQDQEALAVLPLLRYDQTLELARRLGTSRGAVSSDKLARALREMGDDLLEHEWQPATKVTDDSQDKDTAEEDKGTVERLRCVYQEYVDDERSDASRRRVVAVRASVAFLVPRTWKRLTRDKDFIYCQSPSKLPSGTTADGGDLVLKVGARDAVDRGILSFDRRH
jgi:ATPase family associated with various cellular activities (AAA)